MTMTTTAAIPPALAGDFLRKAREYANLTQGELADALGVDARTVRDAEKDLRPVRPERVLAWAVATGVEPKWLQWNVDACSSFNMRPDFDLCACRDSNPKPSVLYFAGRLLARILAPFTMRRCRVCGSWSVDGVCTTPHGHTRQVGLDARWTLAA